MRNLFLKVAIISFVIPNLFIPSSTAAEYPPSVEVLEVGKPLAKPLPPKDPELTVVVPKATSDTLPIIVGDPISAGQARLSTRTLSNKSVESTPIKLTSSLTLGGIGADEKAPVASVSSSKKNEIQIPADVPTRILVSGLKSGASGTVSFVDSQGKSINLGRVVVSASGRVNIPALTFGKGGISYTIKILINGKTTILTIRSTG